MKHSDVPYLPDEHERHVLDVHLPPRPAGRPVVIVIHGGGLKQFSKGRMAGVSAWLARAGFVAVTPNYRLLAHADWPAPLEDCHAVVRWLDARPPVLAGADVDRLGLLGASAGAMLALLLGGQLARPRVRCVVDISGPADARRERPGGASDWPLGLVRPEFPPTLIVHSRNDHIVSVRHARRLRVALERAGVEHDLLLYDRPEPDHGIWQPGEDPPVLLDFIRRRVLAFLRKNLLG